MVISTLNMLIDFSIQNYASFNTVQTFSMNASTSTKEDFNQQCVKDINAFGIGSVLKSAAIFGANASGKSNLTEGLATFKRIILNSLDSVGEQTLDSAIPFLLKENHYDVPTEFEVTFLANGKMYRYGLSIVEDIISEEWLYWTSSSRETLLFHRDKQTVEFNQRSFSEAKLFVKKQGDVWHIEKTKPFIPFLSVLAQFDGEKSVAVTDWFAKLHIVSGLSDAGLKSFTLDLFEENLEFKAWALQILRALQIEDLRISEIERGFPIPDKSKQSSDAQLDEVVDKLAGYFSKKKIIEKVIEVVKVDKDTGKPFTLPLSLESEGTRKLIYLLGPLYDVITNDEILVVDEFDNKFHSLLCKFIIELYHQANSGASQLLLTCHDTNLLNNELFRRDQIWFVEKNPQNESEIYSLVEYKEHYTRKDGSYSKDYLLGKYGAIPLFGSITDIGDILNG
jgi:AAA15 family ATPase/GTPase